MKEFRTNTIKYTTSLTLSLIGSEAFKLGTSIFIYKFTGNLWLVTALYLLVQLPSILVYIFSSKIVKKFKNDKLILLFSDIVSFVLLIPTLITFFLTQNNKILSIVLIVFNTLLGFIHAFRFIYLKNVVYYISQNNKQMKIINISNSFATSFGFFLSTIFSFFLFKNLDFYWLVIMNMVTYLISGILYYSLKTSATAANFEIITNKNEHVIVKKNKLKSWIFILSGSFLIGIFLYPKTSGLSQLFSSLESYSIDTWGFYLSIIFTSFSLLGVILSFVLNNKIKHQKSFFMILVVLILLLNFVWLFFKNTNEKSYFISYVVTTTIQQFLFSLFIPIFYSLSYELFDKNNFHKQNGISIVFRTVITSIITLLFTQITIKFGYFYTYLFYAIAILIACLGIFYSMFNFKDAKFKKYYNTSVIATEYIETAKKGLWKSEKKVIDYLIKENLEIKNILDIGCGAGRTTFALAKLFPNAKIKAIDISEELLKNLQNTDNITFELINILEYNTQEKFDFILFSFNGLTNILPQKDVIKFFIKIKELLRDEKSRFVFTIHDIFSSQEYKDFWINKMKIYSLPTLSSKKILSHKHHGIKTKNRFYTHEDMLKIFDEFAFKLHHYFKRDNDLEEDWVNKISMPCVFYDISKI